MLMPPGWPGMLGGESSGLNLPSPRPALVYATSGAIRVKTCCQSALEPLDCCCQFTAG